ncbi:MAG: hypothetical protein ACREO4_06345 [Lysobacter sp.]
MTTPRGKGTQSQPKGCKFTQALDVLYWARFGGPVPLPEIEVVLWTITHRQAPTAEAIAARWNVSRATGFRWAQQLATVHETWARLMREQRSPPANVDPCGCPAVAVSHDAKGHGRSVAVREAATA